MIVKMLLSNEYPIKLVKRLMHRYFTTAQNAIATTETVVNQINGSDHIEILAPKRYFSLPYIPHVSEKISKCVKAVMANAEISIKSFKNVGRYFTRLKDPTTKMMQSNVVYSVPCGDCIDRCYIGTTTQLLKARMNQHRNDVKGPPCID